MKRKSVDSTCLRSVGHDPQKKRLEVEFKKSGAVYQYAGVSRQKATSLVNAGSIGRRYNQSIKHDHPYTKINSGTKARRKGRKK